jgi:hypothetical protein
MHAYATGQSRLDGYVTIAVFAVAVAIGVHWLIDVAGVEPTWWVGAPALAGAYGLVFKVFDRSAWRWRIWRFGLTDIPDVQGVYEGELQSSYNGIKLPVRICVDQTWTAIAVRFEVTGETTSSTSYSLTAGLDLSGHDRARLIYTYRNQTRPGIAPEDLNDHDGTAELNISLIGEIQGRYYNLRGRNGALTLNRVAAVSAGEASATW